MLLRWWRNRRRRNILAQPFPAVWLEILRANVRTYEKLLPEQQAAVLRYTQVFVAEKHWEGCGGLQISDEVRVTIAAQVGIMMLGLPEQHFDRVVTILVYPSGYRIPRRLAGNGRIVEEDVPVDGTSVRGGVIILSWDEVLAGGRDDDVGNVVFHEFAHQYDLLEGGDVDGTPPLETADQFRLWKEVTDLEYRQLKHRCRRGLPTFFDCYAATDRVEFFAVATEMFFTFPHVFRRRLPELYALLGEVYRQDPATYLPDEDLTDAVPNDSDDDISE